jgi:cAMP-dependent protein kinase regulator
MALKKPSSGHRDDPQQHVLRKNYKKAIELYRQLLAEEPEDTNHVLRLADCLVLDGQVDQAVATYKRVAQLYADQGFLLKAIGVNKKIVKLDPSQQEVHEILSRLYEERGLLAGAADGRGQAGGEVRFEMEAAEGGPEISLGPTGAGPEPTPEPADEAWDSSGDLGAGDLDLGGGDVAPRLPEPAEEISVDALGAALAEGAEVAQSLASELVPDDLAPAELEVAEPAAAEPGPELHRTPLFSEFTADEFLEVVRELSHQVLDKDQVVVREGDAGDTMFVIVTGTVRVMTRLKGKEIQLAVLGEGEFFGEGSLITGKPRTATIVACEEVELLCLSKEALDRIAAMKPRVRDVLMQFYQQRAENTVKVILRSRK